MSNLFWVTNPDKNIAGNAYGYKSHTEQLKEAFVLNGGSISNKSEDALTITSPEQFIPIQGKVNWLFTMFEGITLPKIMQEKIKKADYIIVPSKWSKKIFSAYFPKNKIFVINHGVSKDFKFKKRSYPKIVPFRFLWVGAPNPRKGYEELIAVWKMVFQETVENCELYLKTTMKNSGNEIKEKRGGVIFDGRDISKNELIELYHSAHCFVFPTRGEGFGLTLAEAMATGCPCISTMYSGVTDFFDDKVGYPIGYDLKKCEYHYILNGENKTEESFYAFPDIHELFFAMLHCMIQYNQAIDLGVEASKRIHTDYTWGKAGRILNTLIETHGGFKNLEGR